MEFFQDPNELDDHIIPIVREYIDEEQWNCLERIIDKIIKIIKTRLHKSHDKNGVVDFFYLANCNSVGDILDIKRHLIAYEARPFLQCLLAAYRIKGTLSWGHPSGNDLDELKKEFQSEVDRLQQYLKEALLMIALPGALENAQRNFHWPIGEIGGKALKRQMLVKISKIKKSILDIQGPDSSGSLKIRKDQFEEITRKHNDDCYMSEPTLRKYKKEIETQLSKEYNRKIVIEFNKK